ncbi:chromosome replication/partitioning protein (plasmid) [Borrelia anserina]|uniref:Plasmid partition family protein n=2 Tax=Borrelia anserina TaxID=143 RepID=W5SQ58_BORAN|nr:chromosome replication/partitioning protein [Borrelia anserina]AHH09040.1 Plasmid partition family protein [Borrelia anserina BA2]APR65435.1 PF-49-type protein [Borrelia anserina Es]UPA07263.1 chromosome replication/partitioning protein [Borrelia anserina]
MGTIILNNRILDSKKDINSAKLRKDLVRYSELKEKLKQNFRKEIYYKVATIRILKEIKDNEYYKMDGYNNFDSFIKNYKLAKTQVYAYLRLANAIEEGLLEEQYIIENGINNSLSLIKNQESKTVKKSKQNPIKPLRFQLGNRDSYDFYKKNAKFTSFLMDKIFKDKKDLLEEIMKEYKEFEGKG